jgi:penicillin-binding protein 2
LGRRFYIAILLLAALVACSPTSQQKVEVLPTAASLNIPPTADPTSVERVARQFLDSWTNGDLDSMYSLITFAAQDANPIDSFKSTYEAAQNEMGLLKLAYNANSLSFERDSVAVFNYSADFTTRSVGEFNDPDRNLRLVVDSRANDWRVAWSPADIFAELGGGAHLRLTVSIPSRANIYDKDGNILADQNGKVVVVRAVKQEIQDWASCLAALAPAMDKAPESLQRIYDQSQANWLMEFGTMQPAAYEQSHTQLEGLCAAQFSSRPTRRYLYKGQIDGTFAPNIIGYVGYPSEDELASLKEAGFNQDTIIGRTGIEASWDETLRGKPGGRLVIESGTGAVVREIARSASKPPESVWLTLDSDLQEFTLKTVASAYAKASDSWGRSSKGASVVVMDIHTGAILAMVSYPTFDDNAFLPFPPMGKTAANQAVADFQSDRRRPQLNRPTQGLYPLGSVMKTVSTAAVADSGVYTLDQKYTCIGFWSRDIVRADWDPRGHGTITLPQALTRSCDPYFYEVGYQMDKFDPFALPKYARRMGLGVLTGLKDLHEDAGQIIDPDWKRVNAGLEWTFSDAVNMAIGQGEMQVTPLQVVRMMASVANGGILYRPQLVAKVGILGEAPSYTLQPDAMEKTGIKPEVLAVVRNGLCGVTTQLSGTAEYQFHNYPELQQLGVCGKTGTAQDGPADAEPHAWFAAYAPRDNPQIAIVVMVENAGEGSAVAAPITRDVLLHYFFRN